jgi:signal peptidase I
MKINWNLKWTKENKTNPRKKSIFREYVEAIIIAFILALVIRTFIVQAFKIPSGSMIPTLQIGDHILVNKFIYWFTEPEREDVIVFKYPRDQKRDFIKRLIGLSGETIQIKNQHVYINGKILEEKYAYHQEQLPETDYISPRDNFGPITIPQDSVFVMGDNRDSSMDSRYWGTLKKNLIEGEAFVIYWSIKPYSDHGDSLFQDLLNYLASFRSRIRWERLGSIIN